MIDCHYVGLRQMRAGPEPQQYAGLRRLPGLQKDRLLGERQMYSSLVNLGEGHNRSLEFALERTPVIDVFRELRRSEVDFVE